MNLQTIVENEKEVKDATLKRDVQNYVAAGPDKSYEGLQLLKEANFKGPTSIKYWM